MSGFLSGHELCERWGIKAFELVPIIDGKLRPWTRDGLPFYLDHEAETMNRAKEINIEVNRLHEELEACQTEQIEENRFTGKLITLPLEYVESERARADVLVQELSAARNEQYELGQKCQYISMNPCHGLSSLIPTEMKERGEWLKVLETLLFSKYEISEFEKLSPDQLKFFGIGIELKKQQEVGVEHSEPYDNSESQQELVPFDELAINTAKRVFMENPRTKNNKSALAKKLYPLLKDHDGCPESEEAMRKYVQKYILPDHGKRGRPAKSQV